MQRHLWTGVTPSGRGFKYLALAGGVLCGAWVEVNFFAEHIRRYASMASLFQAAGAVRRGIGGHCGLNLAKQYLILALEDYYAGETICKRYPDYRAINVRLDAGR